MNPYKYSAISHRDLIYANPVSPAKMEQLIELVDLPASARVLDIGTGGAELLIRLVERYGVAAVGVDQSPLFIEHARAQTAARLPQDRLELVEIDAKQYQATPASFDLAVCIGATIIFGGYAPTLKSLVELVRPGGLILVGELFWKQEPEAAYLAEFGVGRDEYTTHAVNITTGIAQNLTPLYAWVTNDDEWDTYEWTRIRALEQYAHEQPDDPDVPLLLARIRAWRDLYIRWGRDTLGFGLYLFQKQI